MRTLQYFFFIFKKTLFYFSTHIQGYLGRSREILFARVGLTVNLYTNGRLNSDQFIFLFLALNRDY